MMKRLILQLLYAAGLLTLYHRVRNRDALTVISLHRVLAESDPRWQTCDPLYTISDRLFEQCVRFFKAHYSIVSLDDLFAARRGERALPPRPLLITFDDGWADTSHYAAPILRRLGVPAALFVAADVIDRREAFFQERLIGAWRRGALSADDVHALWARTVEARPQPANLLSESAVRALIAHLQAVEPEIRNEILSSGSSALGDFERQMLTTGELRALVADGVAIGSHGKTHEPMTSVLDLEAELSGARNMIAHASGLSPSRVNSLSFPFSKQNHNVVQRARLVGYQLLFGGGLSLTPLAAGLPDLIARVGLTAHEITDRRGNLSGARLAAMLFRRPHRLLKPM
jgi:peptidoglycan/xylan/chitin deacetylase (PgdA/CDA1 family)